MNPTANLASGKDRGDENFPVASLLIGRTRRKAVIDFYKVARMADDVADHATAAPADKLALLAAIEASLEGETDDVAAAVALRRSLAEHGLTTRHMRDLITAFRQDVTKDRYVDWNDLMNYCRYSAAPVGRFLLDLHGETEANWDAADALCAALQVINHLQDCGQDYRGLNRVYLPLDALGEVGLAAEALGADRASDALRGVFVGLARRTRGLLDQAAPLSRRTQDARLAMEVAVIQRLARSLAHRLERRDPLSDRVRHRPWESAALAGLGLVSALGGRLRA